MLKRTPSGVTLFAAAIFILLVAFFTLAGTLLWQSVLIVAGVSAVVLLIMFIGNFLSLP